MAHHTLTATHDVDALRRAAAVARDAADHETAIARYGAALALLACQPAAPDLHTEYELRSGRAACSHILGDYPAEAADLPAMAALAAALGEPRRQIAVVVRQVTLANLLGDAAEARDAAEAARVQAHELGDVALEADCLRALGDSCSHLSAFDQAEDYCGQALALYRSLGDRLGEARSLLALGEILAVTGHQLQAREQLEAAQAIFRSLGQHTEEAFRLVHLAAVTGNHARRRDVLEEALRLNAGHGDRHIRSRLFNGLGMMYVSLGLYKRAREYASQAVELGRAASLRFNLAFSLDSLGYAYLGLQAYDEAYQTFEECAAMAHAIGDRRIEAYAWLGMGRAVLARGQPIEARDLLQAASERFMALGLPAERANALAHLGGAQLALEDVPAALLSTAAATALMDTGHISSDFPPQESWWWRYQALAASDVDERWRAIRRAHELMFAVVATLSDAGLRRSYFNKVATNRAILIAWSREASRRGIVAAAEDAPTADVQAQLTRMLAIGTRMNEQRDSAALRTFLLDELIELSGAERALLLLRAPDTDGDAGDPGALAESWGLMPDAAEELRAWAEPILAEAARTRNPVLRDDVPDPLAAAQDDDPLRELVHHSALAVPLVAGARLIGVLYADMRAIFGQFTLADLNLLAVLASQATTALENARLYEETLRANRELERRVAERTADLEQRAAELALINSVQQGLAQQLDMQAIFDLVGDKIQEIFDMHVVEIGLYDRETDLIRDGYGIERGVRIPNAGMYAPYGFRRHVIETREPLVINEDAMRRGAEFGNPLLYGEPAKSVIFVPLVVGDEAKGHISLQDLDREHAFSDSDVRLLSTLASSMAVALENARLFEETKRLLAETEQRSADLAAANADLEQRTAELTLINGVQQALASQLDLQAIFDLVGDKIRDIFDAQIVDIGIYDRDTGLLHFPYWIERGVRYPSEPIALFGIRKHVMETRQPLVINSDVMQDYASYGFPPMTWGEIPKSLVFVPLVVGDEAKGYISLQDLDREHAFSDSDVRLLSTLAASMSVALENARLFGETRRLLAETEQRAAELETVNRIGQALGAELELAALIELTGEQIRQTFAADIAYVALREGESNLILFPYYYEHGARSSDETMPYGQGLTSQIIMSGKPLLLNERIEAFEAQTGIQPIGPRPNRTSACRSWLASGRSA